MAAPKLPFLWPMLAKGIGPTNPTARSSIAATKIKALHNSSHRRNPDPLPQRYGTANEPPPHLSGAKESGSAASQKSSDPTKPLPKIGGKLQRDGEEENKSEPAEAQRLTDRKTGPTTVEGNVATAARTNPMLEVPKSEAKANPESSLSGQNDQPTESLLQTVPEPGKQSEDQKPQSTAVPEKELSAISFDEHSPPVKAPHIDTPRHVHHFDTYGLVRRLVDAGWSEQQSVTLMKAVRLKLAENMDLAREALVSKSQVENETYLFRAACAELRTEVTGRRKTEQEKMRTERTQLQHEVDILSQKIGQDGASLKDDLKGMFDDRKMSVRNDQRSMESKIQRLNYRITVDLQADGKSEVEGLRWVMTRRVILALGTVVLMVVGSLKLFSNAVHEQEFDAKRKANMRSGGTQTNSSSGEFRSDRPLTGSEVLVKEGDNPAFVSLG